MKRVFNADWYRNRNGCFKNRNLLNVGRCLQPDKHNWFKMVDYDDENRVCCTLCLGYFVKEHIAKHKRVCVEAEKTTKVPAGIKFYT